MVQPSETPFPHRDTTERIIAAAIEVHRTPGPGFVEPVYQAALARELVRCGVPFERDKSSP